MTRSDISENATNTIIDLVKRFMALTEERAKTLPYRLNLIETLGGAYETENSKIFAAILRFQSKEGRFEILESLIAYIQLRYDTFHNIKVKRPHVGTEHCHIDIYVREAHEYAIILENKSNWAGDQNLQLSRYIETAIKEGFAENQIYVLYLPPLEGKDPEDQTWGKYKEPFKDRYVKISWRDDILPWMKEKILPNVRKKDIPLSSALEQYVDYWEGQFGLRCVDNEVKMKMREAVIEGLALCSGQDAGRALEIIRGAYVNSQSLTETLAILANESKCKIELKFWNDLIDALISRGHNNIERINLTEDGILKNYDYPKKEDRKHKWEKVGFLVHFHANGRPFIFEIWAEEKGYYGFKFMDEAGKDEQTGRPLALNEQSRRIEQIVKEVLPGCNQGPAWYGCIISSDFNFRNMWWQIVIEKLGTHEKSEVLSQQWADRFDGYIKSFQQQLTDKNTGNQPTEQQP